MSRSLAIGLAFLVGAALAVVVILVLLIDIFEKKQEAKKPFFRVSSPDTLINSFDILTFDSL